MQYEYSWDPGAPLQTELRKIDPVAFEKVIGPEPTAKQLVRDAKDKEHPAHSFIFHVGVRKAATIHYEERARLLLRSLRVTAVESPSVTVRARVSVSPENDDGSIDEGARYLSAQTVAARSDLRDLHRFDLLRRMNRLRQELIAFDEFAEIVAAIDRVIGEENVA